MGALVVGGGIAGAACAAALSDAGVPAALRERGHRLGGRMASRTLRDTGTSFDGRVVDIGASYFTAGDPDFVTLVEALAAEHCAAGGACVIASHQPFALAGMARIDLADFVA